MHTHTHTHTHRHTQWRIQRMQMHPTLAASNEFLQTTYSGGWFHAFENTMCKRSTYVNTLTLELHTSASTVAKMHVCQPLY